ncbi:MAG: H-NS family nucleoid-associated regulatory protein [Gemmobacter sp.]
MLPDLEKMSLPELKDLQRRVQRAIEDFADRERRKARAIVEEKARELGFSIPELFDDAKGGRKGRAKAVGVPKYRHPENAAVTWTGKGRQPGWFRDALAAGKSPEELAI